MSKIFEAVKKGAVTTVIAAAAGMILTASSVMAEEYNGRKVGVAFEIPESWMSNQIQLNVEEEKLDEDGHVVHFGVAMFGISDEQLANLESQYGEESQEYQEAMMYHFYNLVNVVGVENGVDLEEVVKNLVDLSDGAVEGLDTLGSSDNFTFYSVVSDENALPEHEACETEEIQAAVDAALADAEDVIESMSFKDPKPNGSEAGAQVSFETTDLDGNTITSDEIFSQNKVTLVNFWFSNCPYCIDELPELEELNHRLQEKGCGVVGITIDALDDESIAANKAVLAENGVTYLNLIATEEIKDQLVCQGYPNSYLIDQNGNIVGERIVGNIGAGYEEAVDNALAAAEGSTSEGINMIAQRAGLVYGKAGSDNIITYAKKAAADPFKVVVKDEEGNPVEGAMIQFCSERMCMLQPSGPDGTVTFDRDSLEDCKVHVLKQPEGFAADKEEYEAKGSETELEIVLKK
ncbi:MAG: TlpA family protein disulfide reductase [Blautia sp.]|nr:TlpA family protein disulfide reductase [Blautia sp.]